MKIEAHRKILLLAILLVLLSPLPANAACGDGSFSEFKLIADTPVQIAQLGHSVAVSGDTMVVGAPNEGAAYVFEYDGSIWRQVAILTANFGWFGYSVAISGDTVVVGAPYALGFLGSVYVFNREGGTWNTVPKTILTASDSAFFLGWSLAFDGSTLAVGTVMANLVYVYNPVLNNDGTTSWTEREESPLTGVDTEAGDRFGWSIAVSGARLVVGAPRDESTAGSVYVFDFDEEAGKWLETKKLTASDKAERDDFGFSVAIHNDTVVVGAHKDSTFEQGQGPGAAYVFKIDGDIWSEEDKLSARDLPDYDADDEFGYSVAIKDSTQLVGAPNDTDEDGTITGAAYLFKYDGSNWVKVEDPFEPALEEGDQFGWSVDTDGSTIAVGAPLTNLEVPDQTDVDLNNEVLKAGAAYVFTANETPVSEVYSTLGSSRHRFFPAWEIFEFTGARGDKATLIFEADANGNNNHGKGVSVMVRDKIRGVHFFSKNRWALGAPMQMELPADGEYTVVVFGHPWFFRSKGFRGDYVLKLKLEGTCGELRKVSRRKKCK